MKFNTTPFTNIDKETYIGMWEGEKYPVKPGETKYYPTELSKHFAKHLADKMSPKRPDHGEDIGLHKQGLIEQMLGEEILTKKDEGNKSFKELAEEHELTYRAMLAEKIRKEKEKKIEALKLVEKEEEILEEEEHV